jgi:UDP-N-acetylmuramate--alanine ligase
MIELENIKRIYFIGIGGIGMSAIARYFISNGITVSGYDKTASALSRELETEGMHIHYKDDISLLDKDADLVVFTPAVPKEHQELNWYRDNGYEVVKRSDVLQIITKNSFNICIAGTHGKTSISTMAGHLLRETGMVVMHSLVGYPLITILIFGEVETMFVLSKLTNMTAHF